MVKEDAATAGGYAKELSEEDRKQQAEMVAQHIKGQDLVITTAQIPGRPAPRLVSRAMVESMKPGSVLVDLAVESGGNVEGSQAGQMVELGGVKIVGHANVPSRLAPATSSLYARNLFNFVELLIDPESKELVINEDDDLVKGTLITKDGKVVHPSLQPEPGRLSAISGNRPWQRSTRRSST